MVLCMMSYGPAIDKELFGSSGWQGSQKVYPSDEFFPCLNKMLLAF